MRHVAFGLLAGLVMLAPAPPPKSPQAAMTGLNWMSGDWVEVRTGSTQEESWSSDADVMLGTSRTIGPRGAVSFWEVMRIERLADGRRTFWASPKGTGWSDFPEEARAPMSITFANAAHDYPQRITYWREGDMLSARISLSDGSKAVEWRYRPRRLAR